MPVRPKRRLSWLKTAPIESGREFKRVFRRLATVPVGGRGKNRPAAERVRLQQGKGRGWRLLATKKGGYVREPPVGNPYHRESVATVGLCEMPVKPAAGVLAWAKLKGGRWKPPGGKTY